MESYNFDDLKIVLNRQGSEKYTKTSYPIRYGQYSEIKTKEYLLQFNLNGEIKYISGLRPDWPHPAEWLKRTVGNNWVYYSTGKYYNGVVDLFGEYYQPCPAYPANSLYKEDPFSERSVIAAFEEVQKIAERIKVSGKIVEDIALSNFLDSIVASSGMYLHSRADSLRRILGNTVSVLPPDCRHVDYDVIPLMITDGCLYNCSFCQVKSGRKLSPRSREDIVEQLHKLKRFLGLDLKNYNSIFFGQHDSLAADPYDLLFAARKAYEILELDESYMKKPRLFLFGSADSFLEIEDDIFDRLNSLPFYTYMNLGLESFDNKTLDKLKKPVSASRVKQAFKKMLAINRNYEYLEVSANFLLGETLPDGHVAALIENISNAIKRFTVKGNIYLSPLKGARNTKKLVGQFREIKRLSKFETYLYLIQKL